MVERVLFKACFELVAELESIPFGGYQPEFSTGQLKFLFGLINRKPVVKGGFAVKRKQAHFQIERVVVTESTVGYP